MQKHRTSDLHDVHDAKQETPINAHSCLTRLISAFNCRYWIGTHPADQHVKKKLSPSDEQDAILGIPHDIIGNR